MGNPVTDQISNYDALDVNTAFQGNSFFVAVPEQLNFLGANSTPYLKLQRKGDGVVNVKDKMMWTTAFNTDEVPYVFATERELQYGSWTTQLASFLTQAGQFGASAADNSNLQNVDSFMQLYSSKPTGFTYCFPWLLKNGSNIRNISSSWANESGIGDVIKSFADSGDKGNAGLGAIAGSLFGAAVGAITPGFGFEGVKKFNDSQQQSLKLEFPLYNTRDLETAYSHYSFITLFTFQNLKTRTSLMTYIPPKIYEVDAYMFGGIYMSAAYVSDFTVDSIGTTRVMQDFSSFGAGSVLMPEAYRVSITFTDLLSMSSNVFAGTMGGTKIKVANTTNIAAGLGNFANNANETAGGLIKGGVQLIKGGIDNVFPKLPPK